MWDDSFEAVALTGNVKRFLFERRWIAGISFVRLNLQKGNYFVIFFLYTWKIRIIRSFYDIRNFATSLSLSYLTKFFFF